AVKAFVLRRFGRQRAERFCARIGETPAAGPARARARSERLRSLEQLWVQAMLHVVGNALQLQRRAHPAARDAQQFGVENDSRAEFVVDVVALALHFLAVLTRIE